MSAADFVESVAQLVPAHAGGRVALLARAADPPFARRLALLRPGAEISVHRVRRRSLDHVHAELTGAGPYDVVVDLVGGDDTRRRLGRLLFHACPGGRYVVRTIEPGDLAAWLDDLRSSDTAPTWARGIRDVAVGRGHLSVAHDVRALAVLTDTQVDRLATTGSIDAPAATTIEGGRWTSDPEVRFSPGSRPTPLPGSLRAPPLHLRRWQDVTCLPEQRAILGHMVLPASFAVTRRGRLRHDRMPSLGPYFVDDPTTPDLVEPARLSGSWYYLDNQRRGHFGHALAEQLTMTWGWEAARAEDPSVRVLVGARAHAPLAGWELELLGAAGIPRDLVQVVDAEVEVETLYTATPMYRRPLDVHPDLARLYDDVGAALAVRASDRAWPTRVFLSRPEGNRHCRNAGEVEELHAAHGFEVVHPEQLSLPDQVRLVREAEVISGFAGSGMFHIAFAGGPRHVIAISSENYHVHNEQVFAALWGHRLDVVLAQADLPRGDRFDAHAFHSAFTLDFQREGRHLAAILDRLA